MTTEIIKGKCKHGEFVLTEGCPQCVAEYAEINSPANIAKRIKEADSIVKDFRIPEPLSDKARDLLTGGRDKMIADATSSTALALRPGEDIEVHNYFLEAMKLLDYAEHRAIKTLDDAQTATDDLSIISRLKKAMEAKRKEKLAPHEAQVKAIRDTYTYLMTPVLEAERITKSKQVAFLQEQERVKREQEEINRKRMEAAQAEMKLKGELTESVNLIEVTEAPSRINADLGVSGMVDHWKVEVTDMSLLPNEYKIPDMVMLNSIAKKYHDQKKIAGVRFYNEPYLATRAK